MGKASGESKGGARVQPKAPEGLDKALTFSRKVKEERREEL